MSFWVLVAGFTASPALVVVALYPLIQERGYWAARMRGRHRG